MRHYSGWDRLLPFINNDRRWIVDPMVLQEIFQTPFSNNNNSIYFILYKKQTQKQTKNYRPVARQKHTLYANR